MTIELDELAALLDDKDRFRRIDQLLGRVENLERLIAEAEGTIAATDDELRELGIELEADETRRDGNEASETEADADEDEDAEGDATDSPTRASVRIPKPRKKPAMPADDPTDPRSVSEYANALDEVAHELGAMGATGMRGVDITEAMQRRGFPNGKRVLAVARAHPCWNEVEGQRSRFRYTAAIAGQANGCGGIDESDPGSGELGSGKVAVDGEDHLDREAARERTLQAANPEEIVF